MNNLKKKSHEPLLKQVGGKRWARDFVREFWKANGNEVMVEPFAGGIAGILACEPKKGIAFDTNPHLINFYSQVKAGLIIDIPVENDNMLFYSNREKFNQLIEDGRLNSNDAAKLYYYLNKTCYNGLMRFNQKGFYNTPFGSYKNVFYKEHFLNEKSVLEDVDFYCGDFRSIPVKDIPDDATWIIDPPYHGASFNYGPDGFSWADQLESMEWAAKHTGPVLYTNTAAPEIMDVLHELGFETQIVFKKHTVGASAKSRKNFGEVFAWKNARLPEKYLKGADWRKIMKAQKGR